jgi:hypothetical protein
MRLAARIHFLINPQSYWFYLARGWYLGSKGPQITVGALGPSLFMRDLTIGHTAWGVTWQFPIFLFPTSKCPSAGHLRLSWPNCHFTCGYRVSCYRFRNLCLCFNERFNPGRSWLLMSESATLLVDSLSSRSYRGCKVARHSIGYFLLVSFDSRCY